MAPQRDRETESRKQHVRSHDVPTSFSMEGGYIMYLGDLGEPTRSFVGCLNPCLQGTSVRRGGFRYGSDGFKKLGVQLSDSRLDPSINFAILTSLMSLLLLYLKP